MRTRRIVLSLLAAAVLVAACSKSEPPATAGAPAPTTSPTMSPTATATAVTPPAAAPAPAPPTAPPATAAPDGRGLAPSRRGAVPQEPGAGPVAPLVITGPALGSSVVRVPSTMKQGREVIAQLIVSPSDLASLLREDAVTAGPGDVQATKERVRLTPLMRATLLAPGFDASPKDVQEQLVKVDEPTVWLWTLVPTEPGAHTLVFTLEGTVTVDGRPASLRPPALQVPVRVEVDPLRFFEQYWQWLMTAIVIPLAVFFGKRWLDHRAASSPKP